MTVILLRTVIFYVFLTAIMRLMGKRQIGELQLPEFAAAMMIFILGIAGGAICLAFMRILRGYSFKE